MQTAANTGDTAGLIRLLVEAQAASQQRDNSMLMWAKVAGIASILAAALAVIALFVR